MSSATFSHEQIIRHAQFTPEDRAEIQQRRRDNNRLGFAYQLAFVRLANRFPALHDYIAGTVVKRKDAVRGDVLNGSFETESA